MSARAAQAVYKTAGISAKDVQVIELHDCFSANELITYEALGLCGEGEAGTSLFYSPTTNFVALLSQGLSI